jgi:S-DNA-T family DNA segregation ATPase FtsK/SpoIIIE
VLALVLRQSTRRAARIVVAAPARSPRTVLARQHALSPLGPDAPPDELGEPAARTLLLVDDSEAFLDTGLGDALCGWVRARPAGLAVVLAGRSDELALTYRGLGAEVRRERCGVLLCPAPVDGDLLGVRLPGRRTVHAPGRGLLITDPATGPVAPDGPLPVQVALP